MLWMFILYLNLKVDHIDQRFMWHVIIAHTNAYTEVFRKEDQLKASVIVPGPKIAFGVISLLHPHWPFKQL